MKRLYRFHIFASLLLTIILETLTSIGMAQENKTQNTVNTEEVKNNENEANGQDSTDQYEELPEIEIEAAPITLTDGKILFNPSAFAVKSSQYAIDLLSNLGIPGLIYDVINRNVTCNGSAPVILVDGIPASQEELKNIKATDVLNVEYSSFVPVKYSRYGSGALLNIRLKKRRNGGTWNIYNCNDFTGTADDAESGLFFFEGASRINLLGKFSLRSYRKVYDYYSTEFTNPNLPIASSENAQSPFSYRTGNATAQYTYAPSPSFILTAKYNFNISNSHRYKFADVVDNLYGSYDLDISSRSSNPTHTFDLYLSKDLNDKNSISVDFLYTNSISNVVNRQVYDGSSIDDVIPYSLHSRRNSLFGAIDYGYRFNDKAQIDAYYRITASHNLNEYLIQNTNFTSKEFNHLAYLQFQGPLWKRAWIEAKTGLRADRVKENGLPRTQLSNISELGLQWQISDKFIMIYEGNYNTSVIPLSMYDRTLVQSKLYLYNCGNPDIHASSFLNNTLSVIFRHKNISTTLAVTQNHTFNPIYSIPRYDATLNAYLNTPLNGRIADKYRVRLQASVPLLEMFNISGQIIYEHTKNTLESGWNLIYNSVGGIVMVNWNYKKWRAYYYRRIPLKSLNNLTISNVEENGDQLGVIFNPNNHLYLQLSWGYILNKKGWQSTQIMKSPDYRTEICREIHENSNWVRFTITYNVSFGSPFRSNDKKRSLNLRDNQRIYDDYSK